MYIGQSFLTAYLSVAHGQGYGALGVYAALAALGAALLTPLSGRIADLRGPRVGAGLVLILICAGTLLLTGTSPVVWGLAMFLCGAYDTFHFLAAGIVGRSFGEIPLAWGFAIFDTTMGLPMAGGWILGGVLFGIGAALPFYLVVAVALALLAALGTWRERDVAGTPEAGT